MDFYLKNVFNCPTKPKSNSVFVTITVQDSSIMIPTEKDHESYELVLTDNLKWAINAKYYAGYVRGLETFSQLFEENNQKEIEKKYTVNGLNMYIVDSPQFEWRGVMIDSARHFLPVATIKHTIDGLMFNKMNVLHWHIVDQESFPL